MENKRDASSAGLAWPVSSTRGTLSTTAAASTIDAPPTTTSTPSTHGEPTTTPTDPAIGATSDTYTAPPQHAVPFPTQDPLPFHVHRHSQFSARVVHQIHFKIFTPSNNGSFLLKRYQHRESPNVAIRNISSTASLAIGNGLYKLLTIGAITSKFLYYMGSILIIMYLFRRLGHQMKQDKLPLSLILPDNYQTL